MMLESDKLIRPPVVVVLDGVNANLSKNKQVTMARASRLRRPRFAMPEGEDRRPLILPAYEEEEPPPPFRPREPPP